MHLPERHDQTLIAEDPDAPLACSGIGRSTTCRSRVAALPEGVGSRESSRELRQGVNDFDHARYDGPFPPRSRGTHHYHFRLAALNTQSLSVPPAAKAADICREAAPYILTQAELVGTYAR